ncbi:MAG: hypothetical protein AAF065_06890 [Verrucomicrobiota bacterium]
MPFIDRILIVSLMIFSFSSLSGDSSEMTGASLESIIREVAVEDVNVNGNIIEFAFQGVSLVCIYDQTHNRMRIISPIVDYAEITNEQKDRMMQSNFHSALDARYASSGGVLYSAYIHPLASLSREDVLSAIYQVASLSLSFGKEYSSGILTFGEEAPDPEELI